MVIPHQQANRSRRARDWSPVDDGSQCLMTLPLAPFNKNVVIAYDGGQMLFKLVDNS